MIIFWISLILWGLFLHLPRHWEAIVSFSMHFFLFQSQIMATTKEERVFSGAVSNHHSTPPLPPDPPDPPDKPEPCLPSDSTKSTGKHSGNGNSSNIRQLKILHVQGLPETCNYDTISSNFGTFGTITEIRMNLNEANGKWESWISFVNYDDAFKANCSMGSLEICSSEVKGALTNRVPRNMDVYVPSEWTPKNPQRTEGVEDKTRIPKPPMWLVAKADEEGYNYYKFSKYLQKKVGNVRTGDISRFGKATVLIHSKSKTQTQLLCLMQNKEGES